MPPVQASGHPERRAARAPTLLRRSAKAATLFLHERSANARPERPSGAALMAGKRRRSALVVAGAGAVGGVVAVTRRGLRETARRRPTSTQAISPEGAKTKAAQLLAL